MPRRAAPSYSLVARIRAWFGLHQADLGLYLGISPALVQHYESGRRPPTYGVLKELLPLAGFLPATPEAEPTVLPSGTVPPEVSALDFRRRVCLQQAVRLRKQAVELARQARVAGHWAEALPTLLATPQGPDVGGENHATWRIGWLQLRARPLPAEAVTQWHLLQARATALEAEAAALAAAIG